MIYKVNGMKVKIIPKQDNIPAFNEKAIMLQHIDYYDWSNTSYDGDEITEEIVAKVLKEIPNGIDIYLSLIPDGEDDWLEVNCNGEWLALGFTSDNEGYSSWNPEYAGVEELAPVQSGGQSPIEKCFALTDIELGVKAVEYFIRTGKLYPCIDWAEMLD